MNGWGQARGKPLGGCTELYTARVTRGTDCRLYRDMDTVTVTHVTRLKWFGHINRKDGTRKTFELST